MEPNRNGEREELEDGEEIEIGIDEEGNVCLQTEDWELVMTPEEARLLGKALLDAAEDADAGTE